MDKLTQHEELMSECAYKSEAQLTENERDAWNLEKFSCRLNFLEFLKYVKVLKPPTLDDPGGFIPFQLAPHLIPIINAFLTKRLISICKSRQIYVSYTTAAFTLWNVLSKVGSFWIEFSQSEKEVQELLAKSYHVYDQLPGFLQLKEQKPDSREEMGYPEMKSHILALPSTEGAGVGYNPSGIVTDEHEKHPYAEQNYNSAKPPLDTGGGQLLSVFTIDKLKQSTLARSLFRNGTISCFDPIRKIMVPEPSGKWGSGNNGFTSMFFPYNVIEGRDEDWYEEKKANLTSEELEGLTPELYMEGNFPRSLEEALRPSQTTAAFIQQVLDQMMGDVKNPISIDDAEIDPNIVHIYQDFHIGEFYIAGTDTSHGVGKDDSVTKIMNVRTGAFVADIMNNLLSPEELAFHSVAMLRRYHNPLWYIECNDRGALTIATAQRLGYRHLGYQDEKKTKLGFNTTGYRTASGVAGTRTEMLGSYVAAINSHQVTIFNANDINQHYGIIRRADKEGRIEAASGKKDDSVIAGAICWAKKDEVQVNKFVSKPIETLHFPSRR